MSEYIWFQRYRGEENVHSSNALFLLKRIYFLNTKLFYKVIASWINEDIERFAPQFDVQKRGKKSVPDFSITQNGFKVVVEAKEKGSRLNKDQMLRHLDGLAMHSSDSFKILIALKPDFTKHDEDILNCLSNNGIFIVKKTYLDFYNDIKNFTNEIRDIDIIEILEEYSDYCNDEGLIDETDNTIMVRLAGQTLMTNVDPNISIYYDKASSRYEGFKYLALYKEKKIQYVGEILKIIKGWDENGETHVECLIPLNSGVTDDEKLRVMRAMDNQRKLYKNTYIPHAYFLVDKFIPVDNFVKSTKGALYGKKKFYLEQFALPRGCSAEKVADAMRNKTWEDIEGK